MSYRFPRRVCSGNRSGYIQVYVLGRLRVHRTIEGFKTLKCTLYRFVGGIDIHLADGDSAILFEQIEVREIFNQPIE